MDEGRLERVRTLAAERGYDAVLIRNNPDLLWLTGAAGVIDDEVAHSLLVTRNGAWLHTDSRYYNSFVERLGKQGPILCDQEVQTHDEWVAERVCEAHIHTLAIEDTLTLRFFEKLSRALEKRGLVCTMPRLSDELVHLRSTKDACEIELLRVAQHVTDEAFAHIASFIRPGMSELQIRSELEGYMFAHGADDLSFATIVASGPNGANPHARPSARKVESSDLIVIDFGACVGGYHADMTRTVCVGAPTPEMRAVYQVVREAHERCAAAARPGMPGRELHELAVEVIREAGYGEFFGHGLGHGVGTEIHELPRLGRTSTDTLEVGSVFTIEPGIYLPGRFGIRLEDFGVMESDGFHPLTASTHELVCVGEG